MAAVLERRINGFSALQRAEIAEILDGVAGVQVVELGFSALQRAEIAEIHQRAIPRHITAVVSVLFNEPKLLKCSPGAPGAPGA